jgi:hypothetical protein
LFRGNHSCSGGSGLHQNKNATDLKSPPSTCAPAAAGVTATAPTPTLYERLALPLCRATSTLETAESYEQWHEPSEELSREPSYTTSDVEAMMRRTTTITTVATQASASPHEEEEDVDILRPWGFASMPWTSKKAVPAASVPMPPRARSTKSATSSVLRTIRESGGSSDRDSNVADNGSDFDDEEDDASSIVTTNDDLRRRRSNIERRHGSVDPSRYGRRRSTRTDGSSCAGTTVTGTTHASRSTAAFRSRRGDDGSVSECTTLYDPSTSQRKYPPGCMALVQNVWQGIDRAERALLGSMSVDDDLWADLYEDEYDLYSTEMTADRSGDEDASMSTATSSRWQMTAERSGLTTLSADDRSHIVSTRRSGSRVAADVPTLAKRSPRRNQYLSSSS